MCFMTWRVRKWRWKKNPTKWESSRNRYGYMVLLHIKKLLCVIVSGGNSAMQVAARIICNLLLKAQNKPGI